MSDKHFFINEEISFIEVDTKTKRKIIAHGGDMMIVEVHFEKGAVGNLHEHFHQQVTYCTKGSVEFEVDGKKQVIKAGDSVYLPSNIIHGLVVLEEDTVLLDIFTPQREDFL